MTWMTNPANWALVALVVAGVLLVAILATGRRADAIRVGPFQLKGGLLTVAVPGVMTMLAVAGAAQSLLIAPMLRHLAGADHAAAATHHAHAHASTLAEEDDAAGDGGLILSEAEYLMATQNAGPAGAGAVGELKFATAAQLGDAGNRWPVGMIMPRVAAPLAALSTALIQGRQEQSAIAGLVEKALATNGSGALASDGVAASGGTSVTTSGSDAAPVAIAGLGGSPILVPRVRPTIDATSDVPEPATWMTLVIGFAACGAAMRRRPSIGARDDARA